MSDIPTKTYPPEFLQSIIDEAAAEATTTEGASGMQQGDTMSKIQKSPDMGTVTIWGNNGLVELMRISASGLWVNPDIPTDECAQQMLEALRPLIQHTIDEAVERRLSERGTR